MSKPVILTGLRANNDLHIGNYFGALLPLIDMAKKHAGKYQVNLFVPDLHSFTTPIDHVELQAQIMHNLRVFVAAGLPLDDVNVHIYRQSRIPAHSELTIILNCFTGFGEMGRMTQFKDKSAKLGDDRISVGLFEASYVPVGDDQSQHLEFTRDIAERLNSRFGELFTVPRSVKEQHAFFGNDQGLRIKDLADPAKKMSKSDESGKGIIFLGDDPAQAAKKIMSATTDSIGSINLDPANQPGISNLLQILALLRGEAIETTAKNYQGQTSYGDLKKDVAEAVQSFLSDFQMRLDAVDQTALEAKLEASENAMNKVACATLYNVQKAVGLRS